MLLLVSRVVLVHVAVLGAVGVTVDVLVGMDVYVAGRE
jgi:hypothetical protein